MNGAPAEPVKPAQFANAPTFADAVVSVRKEVVGILSAAVFNLLLADKTPSPRLSTSTCIVNARERTCPRAITAEVPRKAHI